MSKSTIRKIVKCVWEVADISVRKRQGRKPLLNVCDLLALRQDCLRNCHASVSNIATWAIVYF